MNDNPKNLSPSPSDPLARLCLRQMKCEESVLRHTLQALNQLHDALHRGTPDQLEEALRRQNESLLAAEALRAERQALRAHLAAALSVPLDSATLSLAGDRLTEPAAAQVRRASGRLRALATEVQRRAAATAAFTLTGLESVHRLLIALTGGAAPTGCYGRAGAVRNLASGSLLQAQG